MSVVQQRVISRRFPKSAVCVEQAKRRVAEPVRAMRVVLTLTPDGVHALINGELDFSTAPRLDRLCRLLEGFSHPVSVDLSGVTFTDSSGLAPLFASAARRADADAHPIRVTALSYPSRRILDLLKDLEDVQLLARVGPAR